MAYKYFTEKLLSSDLLDLNNVFPEQQELSRNSNNVSYSLSDIAIFLKDRTENFKSAESQYRDLDSAITQIVEKYYKSKGEKNPFIEEFDEESLVEFKSQTPREAAIVDKGEIKSKGSPKSAPSKTKEVKEVVEVKEKPKKLEEKIVEEVKVVKTGTSDKVNKFKEELSKRKEIYDDVYDDDEKKEFKELMEKKLEADEFIAEDGDEYFVARVEILKEFINTLK
jgi:hypothetical protein